MVIGSSRVPHCFVALIQAFLDPEHLCRWVAVSTEQ